MSNCEFYPEVNRVEKLWKNISKRVRRFEEAFFVIRMRKLRTLGCFMARFTHAITKMSPDTWVYNFTSSTNCDTLRASFVGPGIRPYDHPSLYINFTPLCRNILYSFTFSIKRGFCYFFYELQKNWICWHFSRSAFFDAGILNELFPNWEHTSRYHTERTK